MTFLCSNPSSSARCSSVSSILVCFVIRSSIPRSNSKIYPNKALARERDDKLPLLPARYHLFARALEGAFVCLNTEHPAHKQENKPSLFLNRQKFCEHCGSRVFELANCTRCGVSYLIGDERSGAELPESEFTSANPRDSRQEYLVQNSVIYESELEARKLSYFVLASLDAVAPDEDSLIEGDMSISDVADEKTEPARICPRCGAISAPGEPPCNCGIPLRSIARVVMSKGKKRTLERCVNCSTYAKGGVVYRFLTGQDAPVSVLAGTLYRDVPEARPNTPERAHPGAGRKLLIFTDNRQRAAFFAPYLQRAQERQLRRRLMVESLQNAPQKETLRFSDWMDIFLNYANLANVFPIETSLYDKSADASATWPDARAQRPGQTPGAGGCWPALFPPGPAPWLATTRRIVESAMEFFAGASLSDPGRLAQHSAAARGSDLSLEQRRHQPA